jgi:heme-degrading monooxygenase HmoA
MRFLLFDVKPWPTAIEQYLGIAASLRPELDASGGCDFIDRFRRVARNTSDEGWLLSFQFWASEDAMVRWRGNAIHHEAQQSGRDSVFEDYRLRVGDVIDPKTMTATEQLGDEIIMMVESNSASLTIVGAREHHAFESIYRPGEFMHIAALSFAQVSRASEALEGENGIRHITLGRVERDYSLFERAQAPQHFAPR